jgi:hypothetical protein
MDVSDELIVAELLAAIGRFEPFRFCFEGAELLSKVDLGNIHDNIQES